MVCVVKQIKKNQMNLWGNIDLASLELLEGLSKRELLLVLKEVNPHIK